MEVAAPAQTQSDHLPSLLGRLQLLHLLDVLSAGLFCLLLEDGVPLGDAPVVRAGEGGAEGPPARRLDVLPVLAAGPGPHPRLGVHEQPARPRDVLLTPLGLTAALLCQLLRHGSDVVGLEPAAAANVADTELVRLTGKPGEWKTFCKSQTDKKVFLTNKKLPFL